MLKRKQIYSKIFMRTLLITLLIVLFTVPVFFRNLKTNYIIDYTPSEDALSSSKFTKENYSAILTTEDYGLGTVSIDDMQFNLFLTGTTNFTIGYPLLDKDVIFSDALNMSTEKVEFIETIEPANHDNLNGTNIKTITVKLNESISVSYDNPQAGYLIYGSHFVETKLLEFYVDNGTSIIKLTEEIDYTLDNLQFIVFYYEEYFQQGPTSNFTMYLIWEYNIELEDWQITQTEETPLIFIEKEQNFTSRFNYIFNLTGYARFPDLSGSFPIPYIYVALTINPPDKELLSYQELSFNSVDKNGLLSTELNKGLVVAIKDTKLAPARCTDSV